MENNDGCSVGSNLRWITTERSRVSSDEVVCGEENHTRYNLRRSQSLMVTTRAETGARDGVS